MHYGRAFLDCVPGRRFRLEDCLMEPNLSDVRAGCSHLRGEHLTTADGRAGMCLMQGCKCSEFKEQPEKKHQTRHA